MAVSPSPKVTYEEWLTFPEQPRTELIDGEVRLMNEPTARHQRTVGRLYFTFELYLRQHGGGEVVLPVNVRLADGQGFAPDLIFVHGWGDDRLTYHGPPPLVIEVVSDERRDLRIKRERYERYGVPESGATASRISSNRRTPARHSRSRPCASI